MDTRFTASGLAAALLVSLAVGCGGSDLAASRQLVPVASVTVAPDPATVAVGGTIALNATLLDGGNHVLSGRNVTWTSSDDTRATVSQGVVTGISPGTVTVTATSEGKQGSATVTVTAGGTGPNGALAVAIATFMGGSAFEHSRDVAVDAAGNIYIVGGTASPSFPTTAGALQRIHNPGTTGQAGIQPMDAFVMKLSPSGQLLWSTFLGGPNYERAYAVEVDGAGFVYVAGRAGAGFPVTAGAFQTAFQGGEEAAIYGQQDGFICKLVPNGSAAVYCSYFGTRDGLAVRDIAVDGQGHVYLATVARQDGLPSAWFAGAVQKTRAGGSDGVVAKIDPTGSQILWATYLGGPNDEGNGENSIRVDATGTIYFLQNTRSSGLPTPNGFDHSLGGSADLYLARLSNDGGQLLFATYIGGSGNEFGETHNLALDAAGNAYVAVTTASTDFPVTAAAFQRAYGGSGGGGGNYPADAAVVKISPGGALLAASYLGGRLGEGAEGIGVDELGNVYVSGGTASVDFPSTVVPFQNRGGGLDAFISRLDANLATLVFSTRIGGAGDDVARGLALDPAGGVYLVGEVESGNFPVLSPFQPAFGGGTDALFVKLARVN